MHDDYTYTVQNGIWRGYDVTFVISENIIREEEANCTPTKYVHTPSIYMNNTKV